MKRLSIACLLLPCAMALQAGDAMVPATEEITEEIVVTGTRTAQLMLDSPVRVDVLNRQQLEQLHARELTEAVTTVPGINVRQVVGKDGQEAWLQGISANRVLVLVDGEPVSASTGSAVDLSQVSVGDIERVEIVKGATSVLYGSAAMGGVINIITAGLRPGLHYKLSADAGSYGGQNPSANVWDASRRRLNAAVSVGGEHWQTVFSLNGRFSDGFQQDPDAWPQQGADGHKINGEWQLAYRPDPNSRYRLRYEVYDQEQHTRLLGFTPPAQWNRLDKYDNAERHHLALGGEWQVGQNDWRLNAFVEQYRNESLPQGTFVREADFDTGKISSQWNSQLHAAHLLTLGIELFSEQLAQRKIEQDGTVVDELDGCSRASRDSVELYLQDDMQLGQWNVLPGLRWQHDSGFGQQLTPKINAYRPLWQAGEQALSLRIGAGRGYRVPNLKERCYVFDHSHLGYRIIGNEDLQPEFSDSYQLAWIYRLGRRHDVELGLFHNRLKDLIEYPLAGTDNGIAIYQYNNIERALTEGLELNWQYRPGSRLRWQNGYTWLRAIDKTSGERLAQRPRHQFKSVLDARLAAGLQMTLVGRWQSDEYNGSDAADSPAWGSLDVRLNQRLAGFLTLYAGINNLNNVQRDFSDQYDNRPVEGRLVYIGFTLERQE